MTSTAGKRLVGRAAELAALEALFSSRGAGFGVIHGGPGAGKSALLSAVLVEARARDWTVLSCWPTEAERSAGYSALCDLLAPIGDADLATLPPPQHRGLAAALMREVPEAPIEERAVAAGALATFAALAERSHLVIAVDDAQWLDEPTRGVLAHACRRLGRANVTMLFATRAHDPGGFPWTAAPPQLDVLDLRPRPLDLAEAFTLIHERLDWQPDRLTLGRIHDRSEGNPLWTIELARAARSGSAPIASRNLDQLIESRLAVLSVHQEILLLAAALASDPTPRVVVEAAHGTSADLRLFVDDAVLTSIATVQDGRVRFSHPLFAEAVMARAADCAVRSMHRRLASCDSTAEVRARHLALSRSGPDEPLAAEIDAAATAAFARGARGSAMELAELAEQLSLPDSPESFTRMLRRAEWAWAGGARDLAASLADVLRERVHGPQRQPALLLWARCGTDEGDAELMRRLDSVLRSTDLDALVRAEALLLRGQERGDIDAARRDVEAATALLDAHRDRPDSRLLAWAARLRAHLALRAADPDHLELMRKAAAMSGADDDIDMENRGSCQLMMSLVAVDELAEARERALDLLSMARDAGDENGVTLLCQNLGHLEIRAGRWDMADHYAQDALTLALLTRARVAEGMAIMQLGATAGLRGDLPRAEELLAKAVEIADAHGFEFVHATASANLGRAWLGVANYARAERELARSAVAWAKGPLDVGVYNHFRGDHAEALIALGRLDDARAVLDALAAEARTPRLLSAVLCGRAMLAMLARRPDDALALAVEARQGVALVELPFERARADLVLGKIQRRLKAKRAAHDTLGAALTAFRALGAQGWAGQAQQEQRRVGLRPRAPRTLTDTESRVADLAASGLTNGEIAGAVFVTTKSVEAILSRVFRKLQIRSRAELGRALGAMDSAD